MQEASDAHIHACTSDVQLACVLSRDGVALSSERDCYPELPVAEQSMVSEVCLIHNTEPKPSEGSL